MEKADMTGNGVERVPSRSEWPPAWLKSEKTTEKRDIPEIVNNPRKAGLEHDRASLEHDREVCGCGATMIRRRKYPRWRNYDCPSCGTLRDIWSPDL